MNKIGFFVTPGAVVVLGLLLGGCAQLHHVAIGDIDTPPGYVQKPFDIKVSETGINLQEASRIARAFTRGRDSEVIRDVEFFVSLFQMGPRTGNPVYVKDYAKNLAQVIYEKCPSGRITGLTSVRESRKYPVVSGEIVKVTGYCLLPREG